MRSQLKFVSSVALLALLGAGCTAMADDDVPLDKAPAGVQATVKKVVGNNKFDHLDKDVEDGKTVYEVDVNAKEGSYSVHMSDTGAVLGISHDIAVEMLPEPVVDAAKAAHPDARIAEPEIRWGDNKLYYKVEQMVGKEKHELSIDGSGKIISDEKDEEGGADEAKEGK